jgi:hypothetical protein
MLAAAAAAAAAGHFTVSVRSVDHTYPLTLLSPSPFPFLLIPLPLPLPFPVPLPLPLLCLSHCLALSAESALLSACPSPSASPSPSPSPSSPSLRFFPSPTPSPTPSPPSPTPSPFPSPPPPFWQLVALRNELHTASCAVRQMGAPAVFAQRENTGQLVSWGPRPNRTWPCTESNERRGAHSALEHAGGPRLPPPPGVSTGIGGAGQECSGATVPFTRRRAQCVCSRRSSSAPGCVR